MSDNCKCVHCRVANGLIEAPNFVAGPYNVNASSEDNYLWYKKFCEFHGFRYYSFDDWMDLEYSEDEA
jgi:hypothetical protein